MHSPAPALEELLEADGLTLTAAHLNSFYFRGACLIRYFVDLSCETGDYFLIPQAIEMFRRLVEVKSFLWGWALIFGRLVSVKHPSNKICCYKLNEMKSNGFSGAVRSFSSSAQ
jgi:hypothetical protein